LIQWIEVPRGEPGFADSLTSGYQDGMTLPTSDKEKAIRKVKQQIQTTDEH
jgi:hypothetical protein